MPWPAAPPLDRRRFWSTNDRAYLAVCTEVPGRFPSTLAAANGMSVAPGGSSRDALFETGAHGAQLRPGTARRSPRPTGVFGELNADRLQPGALPQLLRAWPEDIDGWCGRSSIQRVLRAARESVRNGRSSRPSTRPGPWAEAGWVDQPADNVAAQQRLIRRCSSGAPRLMLRWSMGAQQAYHWAALGQSGWRRICCLCRRPAPRPTLLFPAQPAPALTAEPAGMRTRFRGQPGAGAAHLRPDLCSGRQPGLLPAGPARSPGLRAALRAYVVRSWLPAYRRHIPTICWPMLDTWLANDLRWLWPEQDSKTSAGIGKPSRSIWRRPWGDHGPHHRGIGRLPRPVFPARRLRRRKPP